MAWFGDTLDSHIDAEAARGGVPPGFPPLPEIPGGRYTRADFAALENEQLWRRSWVLAGRERDLPERGSYRVFDKLGMPILLVRGGDERVRAFYNTCRHRGAPVVREACGRTAYLRCQYHSWTYGLDGRLLGVPDERDFLGLDKSARGLIELRCESWAGWIFVNADRDAPPLLETLGPVPAELASTRMENLRTVRRMSYMIACNWKATMDAFIEVYHINTVHAQTAAKVLDPRATSVGLMPGGHARSAVRRRTDLVDGMSDQLAMPNLPGLDDTFLRIGITYNVFPNLVAPIDPMGFPVLLMWPRGTRQCEVEIYFLGPDWGEGPEPDYYVPYFAFFEQLIQEDIKNLAPIQDSMESGAFTGVMTNYQERRIYWFHEEIDRRIGLDRIPPELRVRPLLEEFAKADAARA